MSRFEIHPFPVFLGFLMLLVCAAAAASGAKLEAARDYWQQGKLKEAELTLKSALQSDPDDADARLLLARVYLDFRRGAAAEQELNRAQSLGLTSPETAVLMSRALLQQGAFARALDAATRQDGSEADAELLAIQGQALVGMNRLPEAQVLLAQALAMVPDNETALLQLAQLAFGRGDRARARELLEQAVVGHPDSSEVAAALAELAMQEGSFDEADQLLTDALATAREKWPLLYKRALVRAEIGEVDAAEADIKAAATIYPELTGLVFARARVALAREDFSAALNLSEAFLRANPKDARANLVAALAAFQQGLFEQAREYALNHLAAAPESRGGLLLLASAQAALREFAAAETTLAPLAAVEDPDPDVVKALAQVQQAQGDSQLAEASFRRFLELRPDDTDARLRLALLLSQLATLAVPKPS